MEVVVLSSVTPEPAEGVEPVAWATSGSDEDSVRAILQERFDADVVSACLTRLHAVIDVEVPITEDVLAAGAQADLSPRGLPHRIKSPESLARKITNRWDAMPTAETADQVASEIGDVLRYTLVAESTAGFYAAAEQACEYLAEQGYVVEEATDSFGQDTRYKGLHLAVRTADGHMKLEIQLHTAHSADAKEQTHPLYQIFRDPDEDHQRRRDACAAIVAMTATVEDPPNRPDALCGVPLQVRSYGCPPV